MDIIERLRRRADDSDNQELDRDAIAEIENLRERSASLCEAMIDEEPWKGKMWARAALTFAANAIRRGRHLTAKEKLDNLCARLLEPEGADEQNARPEANG